MKKKTVARPSWKKLPAERKPKRKILPKPKAELSKPLPVVVPAAERKPLKITAEHLALASVKKQAAQRNALLEQLMKPAEPPPGVLPAGQSLAMDEAWPAQACAWALQNNFASILSQGYVFLGYSVLAEMTQIPEYRRPAEIIATEMTRKWIKFQAAGDEDAAADKTGKIAELEKEMVRLGVREAFKKIAEQDGFMGRAHLYLDTGATDNPNELKLPIGDGSNAASRNKVGKGKLLGVRAVEAMWCYPARYNSINPLAADWYHPSAWYVMGKEVHETRLLTFVAREMPDILKPAYSFGGLSLTQMMKPYVDNWLRTRQSVADLIHAFSVMVLSTDLSTALQGNQLNARADLFNLFRDNRGLMMIDKANEEFGNVSTPLGTLDALQAQTQEHMAAVPGIPLVKFFGIQPAGLNATSEGELDCFAAWIGAIQESFYRPNLTRVINFVQLSLWGEVDPSITYIFEPLSVLDEKELADVRKVEADTAAVYVDHGITDVIEERTRLAANKDSPYASLDVEDIPEASPEEMEQLGKAAAGFGKAEEADNEEPAPKLRAAA